VLKATNERKCDGFVWFSRKKKKKKEVRSVMQDKPF
jgi:hypothetical protein